MKALAIALLSATMLFLSSTPALAAELSLGETLGISDYGRQATEEFLSQFTSMFSFGRVTRDGDYLSRPRIDQSNAPTEIRPAIVVKDSSGDNLYNRADERLAGEDEIFQRFGLVAREFRLYDLNNDGIPQIFILWTHPMHRSEFAACRWTLHVYRDGTFEDIGRVFEATFSDFYEYDGRLLKTQVNWGAITTRAIYSYANLVNGGFFTEPAGLFGTSAQTHHRSPEFQANPTHYQSGGAMRPIPSLSDLEDEISASIRAWIYSYGETSLFRAPYEPIRIRINGAFVNIPRDEQHPVTEGGRTLVPLRAVMSALGFHVEWDAEENAALLSTDTLAVAVSEGSYTALVRQHGADRDVTLDVPARVINGRVMIPVRAIAQIAGMNVEWDETRRIVNVKTPGFVPPEIILRNLVPLHINDIDVEVLHFTHGIYRVTLSPEHFESDPRVALFFFFESADGEFSEIDCSDGRSISFIFSANPGTDGRNVRVVIGAEDSFGQRDTVAIMLKGNDGNFPSEIMSQAE
ncbi:MAG: copper amine oxidase N-terminal domain-containing protein [Defluviitaleaceae bacterium]|nr:copper amine oxidase N-terminal domain-containing protein [Defluviitaleaceae bacterium]